ncbi:phage minor head protein [Streptomyces scabiei]|uniref:phage minor head protein n=1 Tax=Streptomyces scabiei TaxID=1930 RepID=UPI0038F7FC28
MDEDELLDQAEEDVAAVVAEVLDEVAAEFAAGLDAATQIVAARFSVSSIARMFRARVPRIVRSLLGVVETAAARTADDVDGDLPDTWDDLPDRYDDDRTLPPAVVSYVTVTEHLLNAVGGRLAEAARQELTEGVDAGEDMEQLTERLRAAFDREAAQLGEGREQNIARTESGRAWNASVLGAAQALEGPDRPLVKQWRTRGDERVRRDHNRVDGQLRLLDESFTVGGVSMSAPGDPTAPASQVCNCRCVLKVQAARRASAYESQGPSPAGISKARQALSNGSLTVDLTSAATEHTGAMIALVPSDDDAARLALDGGEPAAELHCTLWFLGKADEWTEDQQAELTNLVRSRAERLPGPIHAHAFGVNHWNPGSDDPAWVWAVGDDRDAPDDAATLSEARSILAVDALESTHERPETPDQHSPWVAHTTAAYDADTWPLEPMTNRLGPLTFDRVRVAFAGDYTDIPLGPQEEPMEENTAAADSEAPAATRSWSTPGDAALAYENTETGDGRLFAPGSLYWEGSGPWPLQYADEMGMGHDGAELAGAIADMGRDAPRITGGGLLYANRYAGADAIQLLDEGAPLGVSVDLDDVDMEFVDRTLDQEDGPVFASARLTAASVLRMADGAYCITASTGAEWTAAGGGLSRQRHDVQLITDPGGSLPAAALRAAFGDSGVLTAAAGDSDSEDGVVVWKESAGDLLIRFTRARVRGATLVAMPAYANARIVLDDPEPTAAAAPAPVVLAASSDTHERVLAFVRSSPVAVGAREVAGALAITMESARSHLARAAKAGTLVRLAPGQYVGTSTMPEGETTAAGEADEEALAASAWTAMRDLPPMPADWFQEPTAEDLPPGSGGVHYRDGRVFGWVAQAGEPHAGMPGRRLTIDSLGDIDMSHFHRAKFQLDDGSTVRAGVMTMNVGHHRDSAECETSACQFDDTRTVAGVVACGMNERGMWFSGAAAPWLSEWDRTVFQACQPSYHLKKGGDGRWQLRAVLSVPVPGHSSPLLAAAVERSNLALAASAAMITDAPDTASGHDPDAVRTPIASPSATLAELGGQHPDAASGLLPDPSVIAAAVTALLGDGTFLDHLTAALDARAEQRAEIDRLAAFMDPATTQLAAVTVGGSPEGDR